MSQPKLETSVQIIRFIQGLSYFIDHVKIIEVYQGGFSFKVRVPLWYKLSLGWILKKTIQKKLKERLIAGVCFKFDIYSKTFF
jgi:hypothetical protein